MFNLAIAATNATKKNSYMNSIIFTVNVLN